MAAADITLNVTEDTLKLVTAENERLTLENEQLREALDRGNTKERPSRLDLVCQVQALAKAAHATMDYKTELAALRTLLEG